MKVKVKAREALLYECDTLKGQSVGSRSLFRDDSSLSGF